MKLTGITPIEKASGNPSSRRTWLVQMGGGFLLGAKSVAQSAALTTRKQLLAREPGQTPTGNVTVQQGEVVYPEGAFKLTVLDNRSQWITDLGVAHPRTAVSKESRKGAWRLVSYEANVGSNSMKGSMLMCGPETQAP